MTNYNEFFESLTPTFYDEEEHQRERSAAHQMELDALYRIGNQYDIAQADMELLCRLANVNFNELQNHSTNSTESAKCQSQQCYSDSLVQAKQPACVI